MADEANNLHKSPDVHRDDEDDRKADVDDRRRDDRDDRRRRRSNSRSRSRSRSRSKSRSRSRRRDRSRERSRDYSRDRNRDRRYTRDNRDRRYRDDRRDRDRGDRDRYRGGGGRDRRDRGGSRGAPDQPARERTPPHERELRELDRDTRTVFAYNLNLKAEERELFQFFVAAGPIVDIKMIKDRTTGRSKGFAYIEYQHKDSVIRALALTGQPLMGQAVMVKMSEAEKNLAWEAAEQQKAAQKQLEAQYGSGAAAAMAVGALANTGVTAAQQAPATVDPNAPARLLVSNIHVSISETDIRPIFEPFCSPEGAVEAVIIQRDATGRSLGSATVTFKLGSDALKAQQQLDNFDLVGLKLKVQIIPATDPQPQAPMFVGGLDERLDVDGATDGGGLRLTAQSRVALMSRLAANAGIEVPQYQGLGMPPMAPGGGIPAGGITSDLALEQGVLGPASPIPTQCLLLKNMFDPAEEVGPDWDQDIASDVRDECAKYGPIEFVHVDRNSKGFVYVKFGSTQSATVAQKALHGRWFAGKQIIADFQFTTAFNSHFQL